MLKIVKLSGVLSFDNLIGITKLFDDFVFVAERDDARFGAREAIVIIGFDAGMADFIGGLDNFFDVVGHFVNTQVAFRN